MISYFDPEKLSEELRPAQDLRTVRHAEKGASDATKKKVDGKIKAKKASFTEVTRSKSPGR
jgi:hypothetical protein